LNAEVEFSLRNILTIDQIQMLEAGSLDIGFLRLPIGAHSELEVVPVHRESFVLVVPSSHKLARRKRVRLREASGQDFVMYERAYAPGFHDLIFGMLRDAGIIPNVRQTAGMMPTQISLVDSGTVSPLFPVVLGSYRFGSERNCGTVSRALIRSPKTTHQGQGHSNFDARSAQLATVFNGDGEHYCGALQKIAKSDFCDIFWVWQPVLNSMSNPSWLKKLSPAELQLLRDLADVVARMALSARQDMMTAEIRQELERRAKTDIISTATQAIKRSRRFRVTSPTKML
jgi:hypothetical protein